MRPHLVLGQLEDGTVNVVGDTFMFVRDLYNMGFVYENKMWRATEKTHLDEFSKLSQKCKTMVLNDEYTLYIRKRGNVGYYVSGGTFRFREQFKELGGIWKPNNKHWFFRSPSIKETVVELQRKLTAKRERYEAELTAELIAGTEYEQMLKVHAEEIADITEKLFSGVDRWWPLTKDTPRCSRCGLHVIWHYYIENNKDLDKTLENGSGICCPKCRVDWSN